MQLASIPRKELDDANVRLAVIGCGSWDVIPSYRGEYRSELPDYLNLLDAFIPIKR